MTGHHIFCTDEGGLEGSNPSDTTRMIAAFRLPHEKVFLQTFADGPEELYWLDEWTDKEGQKRRTQTYRLQKRRGHGHLSGPTVAGKAVSIQEIEQGQYLQANLARVGVFWTVNVLHPNAKRRTSDAVVRVAAIFLDLDGTPLPHDGFPLPPTAIIESSPGKFHVYWAVTDLPLSEFRPIQKYLAARYGGDPAVCDLSRLMRTLSSLHGKHEVGFRTRLIQLNSAAQYGRADVLQAFPGLTAALVAAEVERAQQVAEASKRRAEADQLRRELSGGTATDQAQAQAKWAQVALLGCVADLLEAVEGKRNSTLNAVAYRLGRIGAAGLLHESDVKGQLLDVAERIGLGPYEAISTIRSGLEAGKLKPIDASIIGTLAGAKAVATPKKAKVGGNLQQAAARVEGPAAGLTADQIPDPEGEGGNYSAEQIKTLLGLDFPTLAADSDLANAYRLQAVAEGDLAYVPELGGYIAFNGKQWLLSSSKDSNEQAKPYAQRLGLAMRPEVARLLSMYSLLAMAAAEAEARGGKESKEATGARRKADAMKKAYFKHQRAAEGTEKDARQKAFVNQAHPLFRKPISDFEPRPWLVGFPNGVWDRGEFRAARREDHLVRLAAVDYRPEADQSDWLTVLDRITGGNADLQQTLQDVAGYAVSGASSLRLLPWLYGEGGTGKGTYSEMLLTVLGDLAQNIKPGYLATDGDRERLGAAIWGKRVALCAEAGNARLDAESLKTLSGGDRLTVRMLFAETFTTRPTHVLMMVANDAPKVEAYDDALKERVWALPFKHPLKQGGPLLDGRRLEELRQDPTSALVIGFTAWLVQGLERVYKHGDIHRAAICIQATQRFWQEADPLYDFWLCCDPSALAVTGVPVAEVKARYEQWAKDNGTRPFPAQKFNKAAKSVGLAQGKRDNKRVWVLEKPELFPQLTADQRRGRENQESTESTENDPISQTSTFFLSREQENVDRLENTPKVVLSVLGEVLGWRAEGL